MILDKLLAKGELKKIIFHSVDTQPPVADFAALVNPQSFTLGSSITYAEGGEGIPEGTRRYVHHNSRTLSFEILFDATGVIPIPSTSAVGNALSNVPVAGAIASAFESATGGFKKKDDAGGIGPQVKHFESIVYKYAGELHRSRKVKIVWGNGLVFTGVLTTLNYTFKMFKADGTPLRATANATFLQDTSEELLIAQRNPLSSDLTHMRLVQDGDKLPLMTYQVYGDASLYLKIARFNNLVNFRNLKPGMQLFFPPLEMLKKQA